MPKKPFSTYRCSWLGAQYHIIECSICSPRVNTQTIPNILIASVFGSSQIREWWGSPHFAKIYSRIFPSELLNLRERVGNTLSEEAIPGDFSDNAQLRQRDGTLYKTLRCISTTLVLQTLKYLNLLKMSL